jgi:hypothetical protein
MNDDSPAILPFDGNGERTVCGIYQIRNRHTGRVYIEPEE